jgi:hypothetical protein
MPDSKPRFIDPPQLYRSPRYTNVVVANGFAFIASQTAFGAALAITVLPFLFIWRTSERRTRGGAATPAGITGS